MSKEAEQTNLLYDADSWRRQRASGSLLTGCPPCEWSYRKLRSLPYTEL